MLVTFKCEAYNDIILFGDVAEQLLEMMGHSGTIPSAIFAKDVPAVLARLERAIESSKAVPVEDMSGDDDDDDGYNTPKVTLEARAFPLVEMLTAAVEAECGVMWDKY